MPHSLSDDSDDSSASDNSSDLPPSFNRDGNQEEYFRRKLEKLEIRIKEMNSEFNNKLPTLTGQIKELQNVTDELESMHKKITVGSLTGAVLGAAGGITSIAGLCLAPFTFGASLGLIGVGTAVGIAGGTTGATCTITNMIMPKNLCETIKTIIKDVQSAIIKQLSAIKDKIVDIEQLEKTMKQIGYCSTDISEIKIKIDNMFSQAFKDFLEFGVNPELVDDAEAINVAAWATWAAKFADVTADAVYVAAWAAKAARVAAQAAKAARFSGDAAKVARVSAQAAKAARVAGAASGIFSAIFVALDVVSIVQYSTEISEINQSADNGNKENIKSNTLKFIHQERQRAAVFQKTLGDTEHLNSWLIVILTMITCL